MHFFGAGLLTAAGLLAGLFAAGEMRRRAADTRSLCRFLELMLFELERFCTPLPELFSSLTEKTDGAARDLSRELSSTLEEGSERFSDAWRRVCAALPTAEREVLAPLGSILGAYGASEQTAALTSALLDMRRLADERRAALREKCRLSIGLMTAGGLVAAVLLW